MIWFGNLMFIMQNNLPPTATNSPRRPALPRRCAHQLSVLSAFSAAKTKRQNRKERKDRKEGTTTYLSQSTPTYGPRKVNLPVVLSRAEVAKVISLVEGVAQLVVQLLYGSGLRIMESVRLRIKDVDLEMKQVTVRSGKGEKDRFTTLAEKRR